MGRPPIVSREQLMHTARSVFTRKGFEATRLSDIASLLKVTPAAILRHTKSKQALFVESMMEPHIELPAAIRRLETASAIEDPRKVLREVAEAMLPFLVERIEHLLAVQMQMRVAGDAFTIPSAVRNRTGAPARALATLDAYFSRLHHAGALQLADSRAAALLFLGSLQSYVFFHYVMRVAPKPYPADRFVDALLELWTGGAVTKKGVRRGRKK